MFLNCSTGDMIKVAHGLTQQKASKKEIEILD